MPTSDSLSFALWQSVIIILVCAAGALLAHQALVVFNDGVRPFLLDFIQGRTTRPQMSAIAFGLSAGFIFGLGAPMALSTHVTNPWLLFLPAEILGLVAGWKWLAAILGGGWGAVCAFGLSGATTLASKLPVDFLTALQQLSSPILYIFALFPVMAVAQQFGRLKGFITLLIEIAVLVIWTRFWPNTFAGSIAMASGVIILIAFAIAKDIKDRGEAKAALAAEAGSDADAQLAEATAAQNAAMDDLFGPNAARLRKNIFWFMGLGAMVCMLAASGVFGGGEATSFMIAKGNFAQAASMDAARVLGFVPLIATTALASGAYAMAGLTIVYPVGYLLISTGLPIPVVLALAAVAGAAIYAIEIFCLSAIGKWLARWPSVRDSSDHIRSGITESLTIAIIVGSLMAAFAMGGGLAAAIVGGLYLLNEALGRPVIRMAAGPAAVLITGVLLNLLYWVGLFTPPA